MKKVFITGISGFAGSFLAEHLLKGEQYEIAGTYNSETSLSHLSKIKDKLSLHKVNLLDSDAVDDVFNTVKPDIVYHLAAKSSPGDSYEKPSETILNNMSIQINVLESLRKMKSSAKVLVVSSAQVYGLVDPSDLPINEETPLKPNNPYAVSKIAQDYLGLQYFLAYGMPVIRVRPFNHIGPRQSTQFAISSFAKKVADIEKGKQEPVLHVGNIESKRDLTDVRDTVRAYHLVLEKGKNGDVYNIGSGTSYKISEILEIFISLAKVPISIKVDETLLRPSDSPELVCDTSKLVASTGWKPEFSLEVSLKDTLEYFRNMIQ